MEDVKVDVETGVEKEVVMVDSVVLLLLLV